MNKMKQLILIIIGFIVAAIVIAVMLSFTKNDLTTKVQKNIQESSKAVVEESKKNQQDLVFIVAKADANSDKDLTGFVVNKNGERFDFDLSAELNANAAPDEIFVKVKDKYDIKKLSSFISKTDTENLCRIAKNIDKTKGFETIDNSDTLSGTNQSKTTIYALINNNNNTEIIKIASLGLNAQLPVDGNAKSIYKFFNRHLK